MEPLRITSRQFSYDDLNDLADPEIRQIQNNISKELLRSHARRLEEALLGGVDRTAACEPSVLTEDALKKAIDLIPPKPELFFGCEVHQDFCLVVHDGWETVARSWKERLFSRPWRPWQKTRKIPKYKPDPNLYTFNGKLIGHPDTIEKMVEKLKESGDLFRPNPKP